MNKREESEEKQINSSEVCKRKESHEKEIYYERYLNEGKKMQTKEKRSDEPERTKRRERQQEIMEKKEKRVKILINERK